MQTDFLNDRPPAVPGHEDDSELAWDEFQKLASMSAAEWARTASVAGIPDTVIDHTCGVGAVTVDALLALIRGGQRICPVPAKWVVLHDMLTRACPRGADMPPPPPIGGQIWAATSAHAKSMAFQVHLEWAERHALLDSVADFLESLAENDWYHGRDARVPTPPTRSTH